MSTPHHTNHSLLTPLTLAAVVDVARNGRPVQPLAPGENPRLERSAAWVAAAVQTMSGDDNPTAYYGINTGFGDNAGRAAFRHVEDAEKLSRNLLLSHTIGVGPHLPEDVVRAALLIRANNLAQGYSGVRPLVVNTLVEMLNRGVCPAVPAQGSLGASGDLAPLAHIALPMSAPLPGEDRDLPGATGYCYLEGRLVTGAEAMRAAGIPQVRLGAKEGVALINGTAVTLAIGVLALHDARQVYDATATGLAMTVEAMRGFRDAFLPHANRLRSVYQAAAAAQVLAMLHGSTLARGGPETDLGPEDSPPQDPYSIRCGPVVMGAVARAFEHVEGVLADELNAATDNPLIFAEVDPASPDFLARQTKMISGANFHGEPLALALDYLAVAVAELASIAERRVFMLTDPRLNRGLPAFLMPDETGLNSGLMIAQYTAASLVSENKGLAHPASVDSIPSSANREDFVSMSTIAARKAAQIVKNARIVIGIELLCAMQALRLRQLQAPTAHIGAGVAHVMQVLESWQIAPGRRLGLIEADVPLAPYITAISEAIKQGRFTPRAS
jgi:histidine ammonia-lyase